jgi:hypothetical protein
VYSNGQGGQYFDEEDEEYATTGVTIDMCGNEPCAAIWARQNIKDMLAAEALAAANPVVQEPTEADDEGMPFGVKIILGLLAIAVGFMVINHVINKRIP